MNNYIIGLSTEPTEPDGFIGETDYTESNFVGWIADYVSDVKNPEDWFIEYIDGLEGLAYDPETRQLTIVDKTALFKNSFFEFKEQAAKLAAVDLESYTDDDFNHEFYKLKLAAGNDYGDYVDYNGALYPLGSWLRNRNNGSKFYFNGLVNYHH